MIESRGRAIVLGAGMSGLLAARVLADRYDEVLVVDRDRLPSDIADRRGVSQGRHSHALLARGRIALESLLPGIGAELVGAGAASGDLLDQTRMYFQGRRIRSVPSDLPAISCSRAFIEHHVRKRVHALDGVSFVDRCDATGLVIDGGRGQVTGVRLVPRDDASAEQTIEADLVVDASGRQSRAASWLDAAGYGAPTEERVVVDLAYASRRYRMSGDELGGDLAIVVASSPANPRAGVLALNESGTAMLTMAGILGDRPPVDPTGFDAFAASLSVPDIHEAILGAESLDAPVPYRFPASTWRHYERLAPFPDGFIVIGDALCSFNPVYGQGMTVAALEADAIGRHLDRRRAVRPRELHRALARTIRSPWSIATGADLQFAGVEGRRTRPQRLMGRYVTRLQRVAAHDAVVSRAFVGVTGLAEPPPALLRPRIARRVLRRSPQPEMNAHG
jgi:2-polyprenyl-6-methoxyphenol hydroxylase-like FAD-dependent oxidoreductase